jgi:hypothetical protein
VARRLPPCSPGLDASVDERPDDRGPGIRCSCNGWNVQNFATQYERHLDLLRSHAQSYDAGREHFAYDIATKIRVFVHDTVDRRGRPRSTSLLTHLGVKEQLGYVDWEPPESPPGAITVGFGLCTLRMKMNAEGGSVSYVPAFEGELDPARRHPPASFVDWWRVPVLDGEITFTRADFVLFVADQEGAHVDAVLNEKYAALTRQNALGITTEGNKPPTRDIALASVRHIAAELLATLGGGLQWDGERVMVRQQVCPLAYASNEGRAAGRNDPCPCESGRKTKHCFGQRRPRNTTVIPGSTNLWVPRRREPVPDVAEGPEGESRENSASFSFRVPPKLAG